MARPAHRAARLPRRCFCAALLGLALLAGAPRGAAAADIAPDTQFTPLVSSVPGRLSPALASDGRIHVAYELVLTNIAPVPIEVRRVAVRASGSKRRLALLAGSRLLAAVDPLAGAGGEEPTDGATTIAPSGSAIVWLDVTAPRGARLPRAFEHDVLATAGEAGTAGALRFAGAIGTYSLARRRPPVLAPPVEPGTWLAGEGCCAAPTHHRRGLVGVDGRLQVPNRFAIDWFRLDSHHRAWAGDPARLRSYFSFGQPLLAAAAGTVVSAVDGIPDNRPQGTLSPLPPIGETFGNHVVLRARPGVFLVYGHMRDGSVRVRAGQRVRLGQVLGELGNSGNSSTPHLHFQVMTRATTFPAETVPFAFAGFRLLGRVTERVFDEELALRPNGDLPVRRSRDPGAVRHRQLPLDRAVVRFAGRR